MTLELVSCTYGYRRRQAPVLEGLDYRLENGMTVLLGPNGAGKSTLLKLAASVTRPRSGTVSLDGKAAGTNEFRTAVAWMPQDVVPMPSLTAREYVSYVGWLKGMSRSDAWDGAREALMRVNLSKESETKSNRLSGGQLRRVGVASALVHEARVLLLDEPTAGMDPHQRRVFRDILSSLTGDVKVLLSTHDVADLAEEADHVTVLHSGRVLHHGTTDSFLNYAPAEVAAGRMAEGAYSALLAQHSAEYRY
ncbi:ATP-binding cassette domain-containing protein [Streptomyces sp. NPDC006012]|uniref:ATP-binding cassette domain-containing protein n=1 Tax=Streptomyces sp. NPDC006012 TaxID=3364739 RepID=UPI0036B47D1C